MCVLCVELVLVFELRRDSHISIESFHARYKVGLSALDRCCATSDSEGMILVVIMRGRSQRIRSPTHRSIKENIPSPIPNASDIRKEGSSDLGRGRGYPGVLRIAHFMYSGMMHSVRPSEVFPSGRVV